MVIYITDDEGEDQYNQSIEEYSPYGHTMRPQGGYELEESLEEDAFSEERSQSSPDLPSWDLSVGSTTQPCNRIPPGTVGGPPIM